MLITPEYLFSSVSSITPAFLKEKGIAALVLDVDDTLTAHGSQQLDEEVERWLETMRAAGVKLMIVSNNTKNRVSPFAARLGLPFVSMACKPLTFGLAAARRRFGVKRRQMAIVGDQLFTDRLAASFFGIRALVVSPRGGPARKDIQFKRKLEKPFLSRYYQKGGKLL
ncbi:YqeG family HAD IIIA-type phosphatase [Candidatus Allofournierella merdipullorum]|uniref:YqeG family HAD IIIA-type phosphatase n=1 Tax=Candidatus Allofournierella merdipullorum TaxID=2838595 RepID=UPI00374F5B52